MPVNIGFADVVPGRLELPTSTLSVWRSNQLSYRTGLNRVCVVQEAEGQYDEPLSVLVFIILLVRTRKSNSKP